MSFLMFMQQIRTEIESDADHPLLHNSINPRARINELPIFLRKSVELSKLMNLNNDLQTESESLIKENAYRIRDCTGK